ncbi:MAG: lipopolysaccharide biosynthesis protein [Bryobacteraceae bacterium]|nr:lipopolysaccharide biosynthesis protein [Bryobacteraceae bacterium]
MAAGFSLDAKRESRQATRQAGWVVAQRLVFVPIGFLFVALIPRLMGPDKYGQFSLWQSIALWFTVLGALGTVSTMTRFVPEFAARGDGEGLQRLVNGLLVMRCAAGAVAGGGFLALVAYWLEWDPLPFTLLALSVAARNISALPFTLLLGLNQAGRWEFGEGLRRVVGLLAVYTGFLAGGLAGACGGLLAAELCVLVCGLWWTRGYFAAKLFRYDRDFLRPYLRFGASFFVGNFLIMLFQQSGPALVKYFSSSYAETGYYHLAFHLYLTVTQAGWGVLSSFGPLFSSLHTEGKTAALRAWAERLVAVLGMASVLGCAMAYTHGDLVVRWVVGDRYLAVAPLLPWIAAATLPFAPGGLARVLAVTYGLPQSSTWSALLQLLTLAGACAWWVPKYGSLGASYGVILSSSVFAAFGTWRLREWLPYSLWPWAGSLLLGALASPVVWAWNGDPTLRLAGFLAVYAVALWATGLLRFVLTNAHTET